MPIAIVARLSAEIHAALGRGDGPFLPDTPVRVYASGADRVYFSPRGEPGSLRAAREAAVRELTRLTPEWSVSIDGEVLPGLPGRVRVRLRNRGTRPVRFEHPAARSGASTDLTTDVLADDGTASPERFRWQRVALAQGGPPPRWQELAPSGEVTLELSARLPPSLQGLRLHWLYAGQVEPGGSPALALRLDTRIPED
ncbi:MAG: hypothetical protein WCJ30_13140 [Deltaproteobacteria bacterium]